MQIQLSLFGDIEQEPEFPFMSDYGSEDKISLEIKPSFSSTYIESNHSSTCTVEEKIEVQVKIPL
jgi:hypothetical protein